MRRRRIRLTGELEQILRMNSIAWPMLEKKVVGDAPRHADEKYEHGKQP